MKRYPVALHSAFYLLVLLAFSLYVALQPDDCACCRPGAVEMLVAAFACCLCFGGVEAIFLALMEYCKFLRPAAKRVGALGLWLCFPLVLWLLGAYASSLPGCEEEEALVSFALYMVFGSHLLWVLLVVGAQYVDKYRGREAG